MDNNNTQPSTQQPQQIIVQTVEKKSNGTGTAGFVLSLLGIIFCWAPVLNFILWILGLILSFVGCFKRPKTLAICGLVLSLLSAIVMFVVLGAIGAGIAAAQS